MKIIAVGKNYSEHALEFDGTVERPQVPLIFMKPDSAIIKNGKHFYVPDFLGRVDYEAEIVVRINKLGKSIPARFAHRYYDAITVGIDFTARDMQRKLIENGEPWDLSKGFDGSAVLGEFRSVEKYNINDVDFSLTIDDEVVQKANTSQMYFSVDEIIAYVSRFCTLKTGDLIFTGTPAGVGEAKIGTHLKGYIGDEKVLDFHVR
ncbi:MAG: fumarylacetoacetate hydrolase family protein [Bacteroidaceae bacterium]|jgi:2-keto-4-pentenoate hydratase/2-oxohepta-3-ene-1,7-dioic acid hydratase in catechol pathway|nr:fumarylacetoacetate hydrolase family protein [Bacteroidaceae bacterium]